MYSVAYLTFLKKGTRKFANYTVSVVASLTPGCEMRTRARRCSDPQERSRPESSANGMIRFVVLILPA